MSAINHQKARVGALSRSRPGDDHELLVARKLLRQAKNSAVIDKLVDEAPELTWLFALDGGLVLSGIVSCR